MQPRLIIAAAFFVLGALIAIPALSSAATSPERASRTVPVNAPAVKLTATPSPSPSARRPGGNAPSTPETKPSPKPSPSASPTRTPSPTPTPTATPTPSPTPAAPITAKAGKVDCPSGKVKITVTNNGKRTEDYAVTLDEATVLADRVSPRGHRETQVTIEENKSATVEVLWSGQAVLSVNRKADCVRKPAKKRDDAEALPNTGPDDGGLFAKVATGAAAMITGVIIFWYGSIWPRRRGRALE